MSSKPSYRKLIDAKIVQRSDHGMTIAFDAIHVRPGFNLRDTTAADYDDEIEALVAHHQRGGKIPPLEVVLSHDHENMVEIIDGHRRYEMFRRLIERNIPIEKIAIANFEGNDLAQAKRVLTSQEGVKLKPVEIALGYQRMKEQFKLSPDEIARQLGKTRQHVDQMLILANAPDALQRAVREGSVAATEAVKLARQHGAKSSSVLAAAKKAAGGGKVTGKALKPWMPPAKVITPVLHSLSSFMESIPADDRATIEGSTESDAMVTVSAKELRDVFAAVADIEAAQAKAAEKARVKAAKRSQGDLVGKGE